MNHPPALPRNLNRCLVLVSLFALYVHSGQAVDLSQIKVYADTSILANKRLQCLVGLLNEEIRSPIQPRAGWGGGQINHDYTVAQIALALSYVAKETEGGQDNLRQAMALVDIPEVRDALVIALGLTGDSSVWPQLADILKKPDQPNRRALSASALSESGATLSIPDLVEALSDSVSIQSASDVGFGGEVDFPVRRAASLALRHMGVTVEQSDPTKKFAYRIDSASAVKVVEPLLRSSEHAKATQAIQAIRRLGGTAGRDTLQRFILENQGKDQRQELVRAADEALAGLLEPVTNVSPKSITSPIE